MKTNSPFQVIKEAELTLYHDALQRWEEEKQRQQDEFSITDKRLNDGQRVLIDEVLSHIHSHSFVWDVTVLLSVFTIFVLLQELVATPVRKGPPLRKYKVTDLHILEFIKLSFSLTTPLQSVSRSLPLQTLPPISASNSSETVGNICTKFTRAERRALREAAKVWRCPEPPQPALLHLGVTAHSHGLFEYHTHFPEQFNKHYRYTDTDHCVIKSFRIWVVNVVDKTCFFLTKSAWLSQMPPVSQVPATWSHFFKHIPPCWAAFIETQPRERHRHTRTHLYALVTLTQTHRYIQ